MWLSAYGEEPARPHERDVEAAMAESSGSPGLNPMHPHDLQKGSSSCLRKSRKDRGLQSFGDWEQCSSSSQCSNGCSATYTRTMEHKYTPLNGGFNPDICLVIDNNEDNLIVGDNDAGTWFWGTDSFCLAGTTCNDCCNGWYRWGILTYCN